MDYLMKQIIRNVWIILICLIVYNTNANTNNQDSLLVKDVTNFYKNIQRLLEEDKKDSLRSIFYSDTIEYIETSCPDFNKSKSYHYVWGTTEFNKFIIGAFTNHYLAYIIPKNDTIVWTSNFKCSDSIPNQMIKVQRNKIDKTIYETIPDKPNQCQTGYGLRVIIKKIKKSKLKIIQIQFNGSC